MPCERVKLPTGETAIVCSRSKTKRCKAEGCTQPMQRLCDWKVSEAKTCDKPLCAFHAYEPPGHEGKDLCPEHAREWKRRLTAKGARP